MASILNVPQPNKETRPRQKSIDISDLFLTRVTPPWSRPSTLPAYAWRMWVLNQPVAIVCRETLIANLLSLDWKITPRNTKYKEELEPVTKYYTKLFTRGGDYSGLMLDFAGLVEWIVGDILDTPFGGAAEIGRKNSEENGRVQWIRPLDSGTLWPTLNSDWPVVQYYPSYSNNVITFRPWEISRAFMSPHSFIMREGWGMAPPEKVYFALDLLNKGDKYYANLLLDIPTAGILDLGDMEKSSAEEWIGAFKSFVNDNTTSFKIPVLYEHNNKVEFIPFGKVPNDIMFNHITLKYAALVAAAYGMSLSDIGLGTTSASGETLAGSIRQERRTRKTGHARIKAKVKSFFDNILPETLEFNWVDYDDELNVALGRARLASSQAFKIWQDGGILASQEVRSQIVQEGLVSISLPDEIPPDAHPAIDAGRTIRYIGKGDKPDGSPETKNPAMIGNPKAPSAGGEGDVKKSLDTVSFKPKSRNLNMFVQNVVSHFAPSIIESFSQLNDDDMEIMRSMLIDDISDERDELNIHQTLTEILKNKSLGTFEFGDLETELYEFLGEGYEHLSLKKYADTLKANVKAKLGDFIGRAALITTMLSEAESDKLIDDVVARINASLTDYVYALVNTEAQNILSEIQSNPPVTPDVIRMKSLPKSKSSQNITVNVPERTINLVSPEQKSPIVNVSVPESRPQIDVHVPKSNVTVNVPQQEAPVVHVAPAQVTVNNQQDTPIVNVSVPEFQPSVVNVSVEPTPVEITNPVTVKIPVVDRTEQHVRRDNFGQIIDTETKMIYKDDEPNVD